MHKMHFSYSTLNILLTCPHNWVNKTMGLKPEDHAYYHEGKVGHDLIQKHVSGVEKCAGLEHIEDHFPIVETVDFDPKTKWKLTFRGYDIIGYYDGINPQERTNLEIKLSASPWNILKYKRSEQRKLYAYSNPIFQKQVLITGPRDPARWNQDTIKRYVIDVSNQDYIDAQAFMNKAIDVFESGDYLTDLAEDGKCHDPRCYYGVNCAFK